MSKNTPCITPLQRDAVNLFCKVTNFEQRSLVNFENNDNCLETFV